MNHDATHSAASETKSPYTGLRPFEPHEAALFFGRADQIEGMLARLETNRFTKLAIVVLNQIVRPFTARWHRLSQQGVFDDPAQCQIFRQELTALQTQLTRYTQMLGAMAGVEDRTKLEIGN